MPDLSRENAVNGLILLGLLLVPLAAIATDEPFLITLATRALILGLAGVGLNIALGYGGMVSFGHAAFFGLGGYSMGILASHAQNSAPLLTWPVDIAGSSSMPVIWVTAIVVSGIAALLIGALSLRTSGVYFIMITLAFAQMLYYFAISWPAYGGEDGLSIYVRNSFPGLNTLDPVQFFAICFVILCLMLWLVSRLSGSPFGLVLKGARQNPERIRAMGVHVYSVRLTAIVLSGMIAGLAGALFADLNRFVSPAMMNWHTSGQIIVIVVLGGTGRLFGPVAGAALYVVLENWLGGFSEYWQIFLGLILLWVVLMAPGGLIGIFGGRRRSNG